MDTLRARKARLRKLLSRQKKIVIGSLLGDGHLTQTTRGFAFRVHHSVSQKAYVFWQYRELRWLTNSPPHVHHKKSISFRTVTHPYFTALHSQFYIARRKIVPKMLMREMSALVLSVWLMDDGARDYGQLRFNSQSFTREENQRLASILKAKFGIKATLNRDKDKYRLRVSETSMPRLRQLVAPYMHPDMQYKLSPYRLRRCARNTYAPRLSLTRR